MSPGLNPNLGRVGERDLFGSCARLFRMLGVWSGLAALAIAFSLTPQAASADTEKRVALVIGNSGYKSAPELDNPVIDAKAVADSLRRLGFQVIEGYDLTIAQMRSSLGEFSAALPDSKAAIVYYAGHGVSVDDEKRMPPKENAPALSDAEVRALQKWIASGAND